MDASFDDARRCAASTWAQQYNNGQKFTWTYALYRTFEGKSIVQNSKKARKLRVYILRMRKLALDHAWTTPLVQYK